MTKEEALIYIAACVVNKEEIDKTLFSDLDYNELLAFASYHQMDAIVATGLRQIGISNEYILQVIYSAVAKNAQFDSERNCVLNKLEEEKIWYMPLKGTILKTLYSFPHLRQMCDVDILVNSERIEDVYSIMNTLGYKTMDSVFNYHVGYIKQPLFHFEMHSILFDNEVTDRTIAEYYANVKGLLKKDEDNQYGYHLSHEDYYIYMIAHEYKHYIWAGTGIRSLLDTYLYIEAYDKILNWKYIFQILKKLELTDFEKENRLLANKIFKKGYGYELSKRENVMLSYFIESGVYGNDRNLIIHQTERLGKFRYIYNRIFLPMPYIKKFFPVFYKYKIMIPILPVYRILHSWRNAKREIQIMKGIKTE